jgi:hypothetical protein
MSDDLMTLFAAAFGLVVVWLVLYIVFGLF